MANPVKISLTPSRILFLGIFAAHAAAAYLVLASQIPVFSEVLAIAIITVSLSFYVWRHALLRSPQSIVAVELRDAGNCAFQMRDGRWHAAMLQGTSFTSPVLTILNLRLTEARYTRNVVIVPDNIEAVNFRHLRIWLRWRA